MHGISCHNVVIEFFSSFTFHEGDCDKTYRGVLSCLEYEKIEVTIKESK